MQFPDTFLWGSSTNAQQYEGGYDVGGKGLSIADVRDEATSTFQHEDASFEQFKIAADHYHHMEEDIDLFGEMGFGIYRFSMSWSRIFPNGNDEQPCQEGLDFYDRMITRLQQHQIKIVCTLYAYDCPQALIEEYGGFLSRRFIADYTRYVDVVSTYFKGRIDFYIPFNEQNTHTWIPDYTCGAHVSDPTAIFTIDHHGNLCYALATTIIHKNDPFAKVGGNICNTCVYPATCDPADVEAADQASYQMGYAYGDIFVRKQYPAYYLKHYQDADLGAVILDGDMDILQQAQPDFLSLTYYMSTLARGNQTTGNTLNQIGNGNPYVSQTEWGWNIDPYGFQHYLMDFYHRYQLPILVLENGLGHRDLLEADGTVHDSYRIDYLRSHIERMKKAIALGVEMIGYCTWSAMDLYSTHEGFEKRYGFVYVDRATMKRYRKDSFYWYQKVIQTNGKELG